MPCCLQSNGHVMKKLSNDDEQRIYQMIVERFWCFLPNRIEAAAKVTVKFGNEVFVFTHLTLWSKAGWKKSKEEATTVFLAGTNECQTSIQYSKGTNDAAETIEWRYALGQNGKT